MSPRVALVGCGRWGRNIGRCLSRLGVLDAVADADSKAASEFGEMFCVKARTVTDVLRDSSVDAVAIASPAATHAELGMQALRAGKHVFVEKPMAMNVESAEALATTARVEKRVLMVGHLLQYHPAFRALQRSVANGDIGVVRYAYSNRLSFGQIRMEENSLWSFAPHDLSMILSVMGEAPERVSAVGAAYVQPHLPDVTTTHLHFSGGRQAHIFVSWLHPYKEQRLVVVGSKGMIEFNDAHEWDRKVVIYPHQVEWDGELPTARKADSVALAVTPSEPLLAEMEHFVECVETGKTPLTDADEGLAVQRVLNSAQIALDQGHA